MCKQQTAYSQKLISNFIKVVNKEFDKERHHDITTYRAAMISWLIDSRENESANILIIC